MEINFLGLIRSKILSECIIDNCIWSNNFKSPTKNKKQYAVCNSELEIKELAPCNDIGYLDLELQYFKIEIISIKQIT